jgi:uncharacterized protein (DUF983 family)
MRFSTLLRQRCPRCGQGAVFGGVVRMNRTCPVCGIAFEREAGYFLGAMYFSYAMAVIAALPVVVLGLVAGWSNLAILAVCGAELVIVAPAIFRYSRVLWLHFDQHFDPRP